MEEAFAVGHLALGYILGKSASSPLRVNINIPLVLTLAVIPDIDFLFEPALTHRGPLHSVIILTLIFIPFFMVYRKLAFPYFLAIVQHSLIGDLVGGGHLQLLWPLSNSYYGLVIPTVTIIILEWVLFLFSMLVMAKTGDLHRFFHPSKSNLLLVIPLATTIAPVVFSYPIKVPLSIVPAHLVFALLFLSSIAWTAISYLRRSSSTHLEH